MSDEQGLVTFDRDGVRTLTLNRPDRKNAINARRLTDVALALHELTIPTIAKVTSVAVGAGWNLALGRWAVTAHARSAKEPRSE